MHINFLHELFDENDFDGKIDFLRKCIESFTSFSNAVTKAVEEKDEAATFTAIHKFTGVFKMLGFFRFQDVLDRLTDEIRNGQYTRQTLAELSNLVDESIASIEAQIKELLEEANK